MNVIPKCRREIDPEILKRKKELEREEKLKWRKKHREQKKHMNKPASVAANIRMQKKVIAAAMIGEGKYTYEEVSKVVGISRRQLMVWKTMDDFRSMVNTSAEAYAKRFLTEGLAKKEKRLATLNDMHERVMTAVLERGASPDMQHVPGGSTGLVTRTLKGIGKGTDYQVVEVFDIDTPTVDSIIKIHSAVREELGQNILKHEFSNPDGSPIQPPQINVQIIGRVVQKKPAASLPPAQIEVKPKEISRER